MKIRQNLSLVIICLLVAAIKTDNITSSPANVGSVDGPAPFTLLDINALLAALKAIYQDLAMNISSQQLTRFNINDNRNSNNCSESGVVLASWPNTNSPCKLTASSIAITISTHSDAF
jgi:hypothetical protein